MDKPMVKKEYELLLSYDETEGKFKYSDFVRPVDRDISVVKHEIRTNIAEYGLDEMVEKFVNHYLFIECPNIDLDGVRWVLAKVSWNDTEKSVTINSRDIGIYYERQYKN